MARQSGSGGGMMFIVILLLCLCSSSSAGVGGYFYTTGKNEEEIVEATGENFELKYQEAVRALEAEKQANLQVEVAKTDLEKAQEQLAIAKLEFEGFEFEDEESRQRARTKVFEAEKAAEEAISRLDEAETYAEKAAVERDVAEKNADSALEVAITNASAAVTKAEGEASARLIAANARLEEAKLDAAAVIEAAQAYADDVLMRGEADRKKIIDDANARLAAATSDAETAAIEREIDKANRDWAKEKEGILADLDSQIETANEDLSEAQAAVSTANTELAAAQSARQEAEAGTEAALLATAEADAARNAAAAAETDGKCFRQCPSGISGMSCRAFNALGSVYPTKTSCDNAGSLYLWKTTAQIEEDRVARDAARDAANAAAQAAAADAAAAAQAEADRLAGMVKGYWDPNQGGSRLEMSSDNPNVGGTWNDKMSSIDVPLGHWVQVFEHDQYRGRNKVYGYGKHNFKSAVNDDVTSYKVGTGNAPTDGKWGQPPPGRSDPKLKDGINKIGTYEGLNVYEWIWNDIAMTTYGLKGREVGFLTTELDPKYVGKDQYGYEYIKDGTKISEAVKTVRATMK
jgi:hypothetical protein